MRPFSRMSLAKLAVKYYSKILLLYAFPFKYEYNNDIIDLFLSFIDEENISALEFIKRVYEDPNFPISYIDDDIDTLIYSYINNHPSIFLYFAETISDRPEFSIEFLPYEKLELLFLDLVDIGREDEARMVE